jgi:hypothetical protein
MLAEIDADFWLQLTLGLATLFLAWAAIFGPRMNHRIFPAKLSLLLQEPEGQLEADADGRKYCFHLWVRNSKPWVPIDSCRVLLRSMEKKKGGDLVFTPIFFPVPRQFIWSPAEYAPQQNTVSFDAVLDFGVLSEGRGRFELIHHTQGGVFEPFVYAGETMRYVVEAVGVGYYDPNHLIIEVFWDGIFPQKSADVPNHLRISVLQKMRKKNA